MKKQLLKMRPTEYLCPFCGERHSLSFINELLNDGQPLNYLKEVKLQCCQPDWGTKSKLYLSVYEDGISVSAKDTACKHVLFNMEETFYPYDEVEESHSERCISITLESDEQEDYYKADVEEYCKSDCNLSEPCYLRKKIDLESGTVTVPFKIYFSEEDWKTVFPENDKKAKNNQTSKTNSEMNRVFLFLRPNYFKCPFCGKKHSLNKYLKKGETLEDLSGVPMCCVEAWWDDRSNIEIYFEEKGMRVTATDTTCRKIGLNIVEKIYPYKKVKVDQSKKCITVVLESDKLDVDRAYETYEYCERHCTTNCYIHRNMDSETGVITVPLSIYFSDTEWKKAFSDDGDEENGQTNQTVKVLENTGNTADTSAQEQKEDNMASQEVQTQNVQAKKETVFTRLYEYPPKENVELLKKTMEEHKPAVRFLVFATSIYLAYKILNKKDCKFNAENIDEFCQKNLGLELDFLKNKARVNDIISIGKGLLVIYGLKQFDKHFMVDKIKNGSIEDGIQKVEEASKKSSAFTKKFEELFPVAISIIFMYILTRKPEWFENAKQKLITAGGDLYDKVSVYLDMAKLFIADKFDIDLDNKEERQNAIKFAVMALILLVIAFVYGKKLVKKLLNKEGEKEKETSISKFAKQIMKSMEKVMPKAFKETKKWIENHYKDADEEDSAILADDYDPGDTPF